MEISNAKSADPLWPTSKCMGIIIDNEPMPWELDLKAKYFKNDTLTISEEAYAKIYAQERQKDLDNSSFPSWFSELSIKADDNTKLDIASDLMNAFTYAVRLSADRFKEEDLIPEDEYGQRIIKRYMIEDDEILKEQFYTALMEKTTAGKTILEQHLAEKEVLAKGPQPTVNINDAQDFSLRMYQPI